MKAEHLVILASLSTVAGALVQQKVTIPLVSSNKWYEVAFGVALGFGSWMLHKDGISDIGLSFGTGYAASAALS